MKTLNFFLLLFISFSTQAKDLELFSPKLLCKKSDGQKAYEYYAGTYIKNISKNEIIVVTEIGKPSIGIQAGKVAGIYLNSSVNVTSVNDIPLIPSIDEFKLVTLRPGDAAYVGGRFESNHIFDKTDLFYNIHNGFGDRFGYWSGIVSIENVEVKYYEKCNS